MIPFQKPTKPQKSLTAAVKPDREQRAHYRVHYPRAAQPPLKIGSDWYQVVELSEGGLHFDHGARGLKDHAKVRGIIYFGDGDQQEIEGAMIRRRGNETVLRLTQGVTFGRMIREQQYLLSKYGSILPGRGAL